MSVSTDASRKEEPNCLLMIDREGVSIQDLHSRNVTLHNGHKILRNKNIPLHHHDKIQVGDWKFRVSIRDAKTHEPVVRPDPSKQQKEKVEPPGTTQEFTQEFTQELDELASDLGFDSTEIFNQSVESAESGEESEDPQATGDNLLTTVSSETVGIFSDDVDNNQGPASAESEQTVEPPPEEHPQPEESKDKQSDSAPKPLPKHLRPQGPIDPRDAARKALDRYFRNS